MFKQDRSPFVHLFYALWYTVLAHTDIVCYLMVFVNQVCSMHLQFASVHCLAISLRNEISDFLKTKSFETTSCGFTFPKALYQLDLQKSVPGHNIFQFKSCLFKY